MSWFDSVVTPSGSDHASNFKTPPPPDVVAGMVPETQLVVNRTPKRSQPLGASTSIKLSSAAVGAVVLVVSVEGVVVLSSFKYVRALDAANTKLADSSVVPGAIPWRVGNGTRLKLATITPEA
jgi:hypothetical protein